MEASVETDGKTPRQEIKVAVKSRNKSMLSENGASEGGSAGP
jgi:hypothetical protein